MLRNEHKYLELYQVEITSSFLRFLFLSRFKDPGGWAWSILRGWGWGGGDGVGGGWSWGGGMGLGGGGDGVGGGVGMGLGGGGLL